MTPRPGEFYTKKEGGILFVSMPIRWKGTERFNLCHLEVSPDLRDMTRDELGAYLKANGYRPMTGRKT